MKRLIKKKADLSILDPMVLKSTIGVANNIIGFLQNNPDIVKEIGKTIHKIMDVYEEYEKSEHSIHALKESWQGYLSKFIENVKNAVDDLKGVVDVVSDDENLNGGGGAVVTSKARYKNMLKFSNNEINVGDITNLFDNQIINNLLTTTQEIYDIVQDSGNNEEAQDLTNLIDLLNEMSTNQQNVNQVVQNI